MKARSLTLLVVIASITFACSAERRPAEAPSAGAADARREAPSDASGPAGPSPPPPAPGTQSIAPRQPSSAPVDERSGRTASLMQARDEIEASQRELDVAGGDCRNACRALGSMDRAAGRLCGLAQSDDEQRRCGEAKTRVFSSRDRVKNTCGSCPDVSVDRNAPIPSR